VSGRSGYEIWRGTAANGAYALVKSTSGTSYTDSSCIPNVTYYYKIRAYVTVNRVRVYSPFSTPAPASAYFGSVTNASAVRRSSSSIKLAWSSVSGRSGYEIWRSSGGIYSLIKSTTSTSYTNTSLATGTTYYYMVRAYRTVGGIRYYSSFTPVISATP
jgi:fibronectin type 3 domain-containing protein